MLRTGLLIASVTVLGVGAALYARTHAGGDAVNQVEGLRVASRLPCDGSANPQEELKLTATYSPGGWQRAFHLDVFESQYCRHLNLHFFCVMRGQNHWKPEWVSASQGPAPRARYWMDACTEAGSAAAPNYILSGWYQEGAASKKLAWKQAAIKKISDSPEVYEFSDPNGGTAKLEVGRPGL